MSILVVEDEEDLARLVVMNLRREHYAVTACGSGSEALELARAQVPDLVLLDYGLPDLPGTEVCRQLRMHPRTCSVPVIMVSARGEDIDKVVSFEAGVDDYVVKPFSVRELMLRVRAVIRRTAAPEANEFAVDGLRVDVEGHRVWVEDVPVEVTRRELQLLAALLREQGKVRTRQQLLDEVWDGPAEVRTVDSHIKRLRRKLGVVADRIETLRGVGYRFRG